MNTFFDDLFLKAKDVADVASKKTNEFVEISKYKMECVKINNEIKKLYEQLGSSVYSMAKGGYENKDLIDGLVEDIDDLLIRLSFYNEKISDMKNEVKCPVCGAKNSDENYYCTKCGSRMKTEFEQPDESNTQE